MRGSSPHMTGVHPPKPLTHPREPHLLPLVERLVEAHQRGADRGGGRAHSGKPLAHRVHAIDWGERGLGGASGGERVGGFDSNHPCFRSAACLLVTNAVCHIPNDRDPYRALSDAEQAASQIMEIAMLTPDTTIPDATDA